MPLSLVRDDMLGIPDGLFSGINCDLCEIEGGVDTLMVVRMSGKDPTNNLSFTQIFSQIDVACEKGWLRFAPRHRSIRVAGDRKASQ